MHPRSNKLINRPLILFTFSSVLLLLPGCNEDDANQPEVKISADDCRGEYYVRDKHGTLQKFEEFYNEGAARCFRRNLPLSRWEETSEKWDKNKVECVPQPQFQSRSLIADNNYYEYRNGRSYLDLDASTGIYRRVVIGEDQVDGRQTFSRLQGCFYERTGEGVDAHFGSQILLDNDISKIKTSEYVQHMDIFRYTATESTVEMVRFDASSDWTFAFCPDISTPWGYCDYLRNGNIMFYPFLTVSQKQELLQEALLIRKQFNFRAISESEFETIWSKIDQTHKESGRNNWKYMVNGLSDVPRNVDQAWKSYVKGDRPFMPDVDSNKIPPVCYEGTRIVTLENGSTALLRGEICYVNGEYRFSGHWQ